MFSATKQHDSLRAWRFLRKPHLQKLQSFYARWIRIFPGVPFPIHLPLGFWFLARGDLLSGSLVNGGFEPGEVAFARKFLSPGMTVLDIGAHHGVYTLLASEQVGSGGLVLAFEPSPREHSALQWNVRLNRRKNVEIFEFALGEFEGTSDLHLVLGTETGCNSLRPPDVSQPIRRVRVVVRMLDQVLDEQKVPSIDFIKLDAEGGELGVLKGAGQLLRGAQRPVILCEVQDQRTAPWGYAAGNIIDYLAALDFTWFRLDGDGGLHPLTAAAHYDGNFVAWPREVSHPLLPLETEPSQAQSFSVGSLPKKDE